MPGKYVWTDGRVITARANADKRWIVCCDRRCWRKLDRAQTGPRCCAIICPLCREATLSSLSHLRISSFSGRPQRTPTLEYTTPSRSQLLTATWLSAASTQAHTLRSVAGLEAGAVRGGLAEVAPKSMYISPEMNTPRRLVETPKRSAGSSLS